MQILFIIIYDLYIYLISPKLLNSSLNNCCRVSVWNMGNMCEGHIDGSDLNIYVIGESITSTNIVSYLR